MGDIGEAAGDFAGDESLSSAGRLVIEQDTVAGVHAVGFAVVHRNPVGVELGDGIGGPRIEGGGLALGGFLHQAVKLGRGRLIKVSLAFQAQQPNCFQNAQSAHGVPIGGILWRLEAYRHMALRTQVVDFIRLHLLDDAGEAGGVRQVAVVEYEALVVYVGVLIDMIHPLGAEREGASFDAADFIALFQQELGQIGAVLAGDAGDECYLGQSKNLLDSGCFHWKG